jgi:hypothetical protein
MQSDVSRRNFLSGAASAFVLAGCASAHAAPRASSAQASEVDATLARLLADNRAKHPIYGGGLANHLSMELCALAALGASSKRLEEFSADYSKRLDPFPLSGASVSKSSWRAQLGDADALAGFATHFRDDLRARGREEVLRETLPVFAPSVSSELFHCMIRTAFAVHLADDDEIAHGLAYWAIKQQTLGELSAREGGEHDFAALLARVRSTPQLAGARLSGNSNPGRMRQAASIEQFPAVVDSYAVDDKSLDGIARGVLELYASTRDFTALHAVTSTQALRVLLPYFPDRDLALRYHAQALLAAYVRIGAPAIDAGEDDSSKWDAIVAAAVASADDHDAKFVYACRDEQTARGGELYRVAAARRVERA